MTAPLATVNGAAALASAPRHVLDFEPPRDGFAFPNSFRWTDDDLAMLTDELRPVLRALVLGSGGLLGGVLGRERGALAGLGAAVTALALRAPERLVHRLARRWPTFGLCGGMALAAAERWPHRAGLPTSQLEPGPLRAHLRRRQAQTIRAAGPTFVRYWLAALAGPSNALRLGGALQREIGLARRRIEAGRPVVLGLVGDAPDPFAMHQVVAFGFETEPRGATTFLVYDPNAPGHTRRVRAQAKNGRAYVETDLPTGPKRNGGYHINRTPGRLAMAFVVDV